MDDLSSDDSTLLSARKRVPPKKRPMQLLNVFSSDSSSSDSEDDDEVQTLSGSQPLSIGTMGSPAFGTQEEHSASKFFKLSKVAGPVVPLPKQPEPKSKPKTAKQRSTVAQSKPITERAPKISLDNSKQNTRDVSSTAMVDLTMTPDRNTPGMKKKLPKSNGPTSTVDPVGIEKSRFNGGKATHKSRPQSVLVQATKTNSPNAPASTKPKTVKRITAKLSKASVESADGVDAGSNPNKGESLTAPKQTHVPSVIAKPPPKESAPVLGTVDCMITSIASSQPLGSGDETAKLSSNAPASKQKKKSKATGKKEATGLPKTAPPAQRSKKASVSIKAKLPNECTGSKVDTSNAKRHKAAVSVGTTDQPVTKPKTSTAPIPLVSTTQSSKDQVDKSGPNKRAASNSTSTKPKAPLTKKSKKMSFQDQVVNKLFWSFKPFTIRSLCDELKATENTVEFCMLSLVDKGVAIKKDFTSAKGRVKTLYWANHDTKSKEVNLGTETTAAERHETKQQVQDLQSQESHLGQQLAVTLQQPSNADLSNNLAKAEDALKKAKQMVKAMKDRIDAHKSRLANPKKRPFSACSKQVVCSPKAMKFRINHMRNEWVKRKAKCRDFIDLLADGMEKKPKDVIKLLDIETDESCDAALPSKYQLD